MPATVDRIYRFSVKGLRGESLNSVALTKGQGVPHDRRFALARGDTKLDPNAPHWLPKQWFVMLMRDAAVSRLGCQLDESAGTVTLSTPLGEPCVASFATADGQAQLAAYANDFLGARREGPVRWVEAGAASFTDVPQNCVSVLNLESVHALSEHVGQPLDPLRFRANLWIAGAPPWSEFDWVGQDIHIGDAVLHIPSRIPRCAATGVNPDSAERDVNVLKALRTAYGHYDMGVYAEVVRGATLRVGDAVTPPAQPRARSWLAHWLRFFRFLARSAPIVLRRR